VSSQTLIFNLPVFTPQHFPIAEAPLNVIKSRKCNWPLMWKDCDLQQIAPAKQKSRNPGSVPNRASDSLCDTNKALLLCRERLGAVGHALSLTEVEGGAGAERKHSSWLPAQWELRGPWLTPVP
jgi:hypothetical protein